MIWLLPWEEVNDRRHLPLVVWLLLAINIGVFLAILDAEPATVTRWYETYSLYPADPRWYQFLSADFLHGGLVHLFGNMMFLYLLGNNVEDMFGPLGFLLLFLLGGFLGDLVFIGANSDIDLPTIGASGCIAAVAGAYAVLFARNQCSVRVMFLVFPVWRLRLDAIWMLLLWFGADLYLTVATHGRLGEGGGVNFVSHGIGFAFGFGIGLLARSQGAVRRYETFAGSHGLFGYLPHEKHPAYGTKTVPRTRGTASRQRRR